MGESGWSNTARNPTSTAWGIPQFLKSTGAAYGLTYGDTNPAAQIAAGLQYIKDVYGTPANAYAKWRSRSPHWYGAGGVINEPVLGVGLRSGARYGFGERGPETVIPGRLRGGGGDIHVHIDGRGSDLDLENRIVRVIDNARRKGRL
jgi:SLT domain-containing protein